MRRRMFAWLGFALCLGIAPCVEAQNEEEEQSLPGSIRVQPLKEGLKGGWITLKGYLLIGTASISSDGKWVAFDGYKKGYSASPAEIWIAHPDGTGLKKLTNGAMSRFSPDGKTLIFAREKDVPTEDQKGVFTIEMDGKNERRICAGRWPEWSPDGKQIVFSRTETQGIIGGATRLSRIYIANADGTDPKAIADGDCPCWSPDGKSISCSFADRALGERIVRVIDLQTGREQFLGYGWYRPNWLPDSQRVAADGISKNGTEQMNILSKGRASEPEVIFSEFSRANAPYYSPDGKYALFTADRPKFEDGK